MCLKQKYPETKCASSGASACAAPLRPAQLLMAIVRWTVNRISARKIRTSSFNKLLSLSLLKKSMFLILRNFQKSETSSIWRSHYISYVLSHLYWYSTYARQGFLWVSWRRSSKTLSTRPISFTSLPFCAGPGLVGLAIVSIWHSCGKPSTKFPHGDL